MLEVQGASRTLMLVLQRSLVDMSDMTRTLLYNNEPKMPPAVVPQSLRLSKKLEFYLFLGSSEGFLFLV